MSCTDSAIDLLILGDEGREKPYLNTIMSPLLGAFFGFGTGIVLNMAGRKPVLSGIQKHIIASGLWTGVFLFVEKRREHYLQERDAIMKDYIRLHPEDFPNPERKKIGELFDPWYPIR